MIGTTRRDFLKKAGTAALAIGAGMTVDSIVAGCATVGFKETNSVVYPPIKGNKVQPPADGCFIGSFFRLDPQGILCQEVYKSFEFWYGKVPRIACLHARASRYGFPAEIVNKLIEHGLIPSVWFIPGWGENDTLNEIIQGAADKEIIAFAKEAAKVKSPFFFRTLIEMTLPAEKHWPWAGQPKYYSKAYAHIWQIFEDEGANEYMTWLWNPYVGHIFGAGMERYYPGDKYVDWIAFNGYNFGSSQTSFKRWETFDDLFSRAYKSTRKNHPDKPIMIAEFACNEEPGKPAWIKNAYNKLKTEYKGIKAAVYWDADWSQHTITSPMLGSILLSKESHEAFKQAISDPYFIGAK